MKKAKILALLMAACMLATVFAACTTPAGTSSGTPSTPAPAGASSTAEELEMYTIQFLTEAGAAPSIAWGDTELGKFVQEKFKINIEVVPFTGDFNERANLMLAGNDYNEVMYLHGNDIVKSYIDAGKLLPLDDYLASMPDFTARYENQLPYWRIPGDGVLYKWESMVPMDAPGGYSPNDISVRSDVLEHYGWDVPLSADDYVELLAKAVKDFPETPDGQKTVGLTLPMAEAYGLAGIVPVLMEKGEYISQASNAGYLFDWRTREFVDYFTNPYVKESFEFFNKLYRAGALDEECFTDTLDITYEKMDSGRALAVWYVGKWRSNESNRIFEDNGNPEMAYVAMPIQSNTSVANGEKRQWGLEVTRPYESMVLTDKCQYPERIMELLNFFATDEGGITLLNGFEGEHWTRDADGKRVPTDTLLQTMSDAELRESIGLGYKAFLPHFNSVAADGQAHDILTDPALVDQYRLTQRERDAYAAMGWDSQMTWYNENVIFQAKGVEGAIAPDPASDLGRLNEQMTDVRLKYSARLIMAETEDDFEAMWQEAMDEYSMLDYMQLIDGLNGMLAELSEDQP